MTYERELANLLNWLVDCYVASATDKKLPRVIVDDSNNKLTLYYKDYSFTVTREDVIQTLQDAEKSYPNSFYDHVFDMFTCITLYLSKQDIGKFINILTNTDCFINDICPYVVKTTANTFTFDVYNPKQLTIGNITLDLSLQNQYVVSALVMADTISSYEHPIRFLGKTVKNQPNQDEVSLSNLLAMLLQNYENDKPILSGISKDNTIIYCTTKEDSVVVTSSVSHTINAVKKASDMDLLENAKTLYRWLTQYRPYDPIYQTKIARALLLVPCVRDMLECCHITNTDDIVLVGKSMYDSNEERYELSDMQLVAFESLLLALTSSHRIDLVELYTTYKGDTNMKEENIVKVFISQPMRDKTEQEIVNQRNDVLEKVQNLLRSITKNENLQVEEIQSYFGIGGSNNKPLASLGKSIELMADADLVVRCKDWQNYRGCKIESYVAEQYNIPCLDIN